MSYAQTTLGGFVDLAGESLQDPGHVWWTAEEIKSATREGLRLWGALATAFRERGSFSATTGTSFYDLSSVLATLRPRTIVLDDLVKEIQGHLAEPITGLAGTGMTTQFTMAAITHALARARNQFVLDARLPYTTTPGISVGAGVGTVALTDTIALVERATWTGADGRVSPLRREDSWSAGGWDPRWPLDPGVPIAYSMTETKPIELRLIPPPLAAGTLNLVRVLTLAMNEADPAAPFALPDEFTPAVKYHALAEILANDGPGRDDWRAKYALARYQHIVDTARLMESAIVVQVAGVPLRLEALASVDSGMPWWGSQSGSPVVGAVVFDLIALAPVPNRTLALDVDVVRSAPVPAADGDFIQLGREEITYLLSYVKHVMSLKLGGGEFQAAQGEWENFLAGAQQRGGFLAKRAKYQGPIFGTGRKEEQLVPAH